MFEYVAEYLLCVQHLTLFCPDNIKCRIEIYFAKINYLDSILNSFLYPS